MDNYYNHLRKEIIEYLPQEIKTLLDVGCGNGNTSSFIKKNYDLELVVGIENELEAYLNSSKKLDKVIQLDLNADRTLHKHINDKFDCILLLDVLEHLIDPYNLLKSTGDFLNKDGIVIISLPNIRHYSVLLDLILKSEWEYSDEGILDNTHLRFFTLKSMKRMIEQAGFKIIEYKSNKQFYRKFKIINRLLLNQLTEFSDFQYIFKCAKIND